MAIIPENSLYVQANFKETQIEKMHIGQKVKLKLDAYQASTLPEKLRVFSRFRRDFLTYATRQCHRQL